MVLITADSSRDLADNQIPMGDVGAGLVEEGGKMGASMHVLMLLGPHETPDQLLGSQAPSIPGSDHVLGLSGLTVCLSGD